MAIRAASAIALAAAALGLWACGGDRLSAEEFARLAGAVCGESDERAIEAQPVDSKPRTFDEAEGQLEELASIASDELERIEDLNEPEELSDAVESYLDQRREAIELMEEALDALDDGKFSGYRKAQEQLNRGQRARAELAHEAGIDRCSRRIRDYRF